MTIHTFDRLRGEYHFSLNAVNTLTHRHPVTEVLYSRDGSFDLVADGQHFKDQTFAVVLPGVAHRLCLNSGRLTVFMTEQSSTMVRRSLLEVEIQFPGDNYAGTLPDADQQHMIKSLHTTAPLWASFEDTRVAFCLEWLNTTGLTPTARISDLPALVHLSESRLSHLFRERVGLSLRQYQQWSRLKRAFELILTEGMTHYSASIVAGFHDPAHLSRSFKNLLGLPPSAVYNSSTVQD